LLNAACLYHFRWRKKKAKYYIIPSSYFKNKGITAIPVKPLEKKQPQAKTTNATQAVAKEVEEVKTTPPIKLDLNTKTKRTSGLSLSSIKAKKAHQTKQIEVEVKEQDLPKMPFTEKELITCWFDFTKITQEKGKHNLASILAIDVPKVKGTTIHLEFPSETNKVELERQQYDLMGYLRKSLNNYDISLSITVNEAVSKKYAYTTKEKYEKLKEKNPALENLRKTFDLDI
jgi:DNA polymerase-3 subunit gamma/tau